LGYLFGYKHKILIDEDMWFSQLLYHVDSFSKNFELIKFSNVL